MPGQFNQQFMGSSTTRPWWENKYMGLEDRNALSAPQMRAPVGLGQAAPNQLGGIGGMNIAPRIPAPLGGGPVGLGTGRPRPNLSIQNLGGTYLPPSAPPKPVYQPQPAAGGGQPNWEALANNTLGSSGRAARDAFGGGFLGNSAGGVASGLTGDYNRGGLQNLIGQAANSAIGGLGSLISDSIGGQTA